MIGAPATGDTPTDRAAQRARPRDGAARFPNLEGPFCFQFRSLFPGRKQPGRRGSPPTSREIWEWSRSRPTGWGSKGIYDDGQTVSGNEILLFFGWHSG